MSRIREEVHADLRGDVGWILFDAPGANLLTRVAFDRISVILDEYEADQSVRTVVFGALQGGKHFCGGTNLRWMQDLQNSPEIGNETIDYFYEIGRRIVCFPKPTIAAIKDGICGGIGFELALCCRDVVVSEKNIHTIKFAALANRYGFMLGLGVLWRLSHKIRINHAARFLIKKDFTSLDAAYNIGIVDEILPGKDFMEEVRTFARLSAGSQKTKRDYPCIFLEDAHISKKIIQCLSSGCPAHTVKRTLKALETVVQVETFEEAVDIEKRFFKELFFSRDAKEGIAAFIDKREPKFSATIS